MVKNPPANAGYITDVGLIPGSGWPLEEGMPTHSSILAWRIPWSLAGYSPWGHTVSRTQLSTRANPEQTPGGALAGNGQKALQAFGRFWACFWKQSESESRTRLFATPYSPWNFSTPTGVGSCSLLQGFSQHRVSHIAGRFCTSWATREAQEYWSG